MTSVAAGKKDYVTKTTVPTTIGCRHPPRAIVSILRYITLPPRHPHAPLRYPPLPRTEERPPVASPSITVDPHPHLHSHHHGRVPPTPPTYPTLPRANTLRCPTLPSATYATRPRASTLRYAALPYAEARLRMACLTRTPPPPVLWWPICYPSPGA